MEAILGFEKRSFLSTSSRTHLCPHQKNLNTTIHGAITCIFNLCDKLGCSQWQKIGESTTISSIVGVVSLPFSCVLGFMFIYKGRSVVCLLGPVRYCIESNF
jgi:hypothetical protein